MAKKKSISANQTKNASSKPQDKLGSAILSGTILSLIVIIVGFAYLILIERPANNTANISNQSQTLVESQVSLLDQALTQLRSRLAEITLSEELIVALNEQDPQLLGQYRNELKRAFPEAVTTKLISLGPMGIASLNKESRELRNNIELDLLRSASNGLNVEPEAYKYEGRWLFSLAEPVKSNDKDYASGALLVTLDEQYLRSLLSQLDDSLGQTTLIQQFNNKQSVIANSGTPPIGNISINSDTSVSHWQLIFTPSAELISKSSQSAMTLWILLGGSVLAIAISALYSQGKLRKLLAQNLLLLTSPPRANSEPYSLQGFQEAAEQLKLSTDSQAKKPTAEETAVTDTPEEDVSFSLDELDDEDTEPQPDLPPELPDNIFRAYDIRGLAEEELTDEVVQAIGMAIGSEAIEHGQQSVVVSSDIRHSSPRIKDALTKGLLASGRDVIDIGTQATPLLYFATHQLNTKSGVMITGSHNPSEYNGLKVVIDGQALSNEGIQALKNRIHSSTFSNGQGEYSTFDISQDYVDFIINDVAIAQPLKLALDAGNGVTGAVAQKLFEDLGCEVIPLYCDADGDFPNHHPDPSVEANLEDLKLVVKENNADLGIAFDGDGDRLAVITASGQYVPADRLLMLFAQDVVSRNPGADVLFDVKCTRNLNTLISNYGGRPIMWKSGHSYMKEKMQETGALLGGEFSGHIFFKERWFGFDDGMYAAARLVEILSTTDPDMDIQLEAFPNSISSAEIYVETTDTEKFDIIEQLIANQQFSGAKISTLDGLRVDFPDGWGLVRASNTTPKLVLRFEADTDEAMTRIQDQFKQHMHDINNSLQLDF